ncbi:hypothetical protein ALP75_201500 [Pseudomonas syringae pv. actinidiae]|nr:hypothetical protein ALP75_201500 [Pseudomonas syringae pv. actinidiae]
MRQFIDGGEGGANGFFCVIQLRDEPRKFLTKGDRRGVHHVRAPGLDQLHVARGLFGQPAGQLGNRRQQLVLDRLRGGNVHGGREAVVGALRAVDVIVGVHWRFAATALAGQFVSAAGNHFVDVHVALRATAGLPDHQRKLRVVLTVEHLVGSLFDQPGDIGRQVAVAVVDACGGFLDQGQRMQHGQRHTLVANRKVDQ